jgi:hypothetical protein
VVDLLGKCKICGKETIGNLSYCSKECLEADKNQSKIAPDTDKFMTQFDKGHGSVRREANIKKVMQMLKDGIPEDEIRFQLSILFRDMTVDSYLRCAKQMLERESKGS